MQNIELKLLKNCYCDAVGLALSEFFDVWSIDDENDILKNLNIEQLHSICEYAILKNKIGGVGELNLKVPIPEIARPFFDKYEIDGKEILSARLIDGFSARDFVGGRIILEVENLLEYGDDYLSKTVDFSATVGLPVLIKMGQTLEEVGKVVNKFDMSPAEVLEDYGFLDRECYIYGLNFLDKEDQRLLKNYNTTLILSPRDDGESGRGAINLYNLIFNDLKFAFSSGKCYNVDMFSEGKLAIINTSNLMYERGLVSTKDVLEALQGRGGKLMINLDNECMDTILDTKIEIENDAFKNRLYELRKEVKLIAEKLKEKI